MAIAEQGETSKQIGLVCSYISKENQIISY